MESNPLGFGKSLRVVILPSGILFVDCYDCGLMERIGVGESKLLLRIKCAQTVEWYRAGKGSCFGSTKEAADFFGKFEDAPSPGSESARIAFGRLADCGSTGGVVFGKASFG